MSVTDIFLARQPILDRDQNIVAYELLFRHGYVATAQITNPLEATAHVVTSLFGEMGINSVLGKHLGFINISGDLLLSDMLELLPAEQIVLELLETVEITPTIIERCKVLKRRGFHLALDDVTELTPAQREILPLINIVKLDLLQMTPEALEKTANALRKSPIKLLAEKLDQPQQFQQCLDLGFHYFQGYYFAKPAIISGKRAEPSKLALLKLLGLVIDDAETEEIETALKYDPKLSYNLLRLVNSVGCGSTQKISSLSQAIMVIGRRQLQRWVQLLLFAMHGTGGQIPNPLMQLAATRGKMLEILSRMGECNERARTDLAFMTGIFSLLDVLLSMPMDEIVKQLNLTEDVKSALTQRAGNLGMLLRLCEYLERGDFDRVEQALTELPGLTRAEVTEAQLAAVRWVNSLGESVQ